MQAIVRLVALYFIILMCVPCQDCETRVDEDNVTVASVTDNPYAGCCDLFCSCQCCSSFFLIRNVNCNIPVLLLFVKKNRPSYKHFLFLSSFNKSIWQPPKFIA